MKDQGKTSLKATSAMRVIPQAFDSAYGNTYAPIRIECLWEDLIDTFHWIGKRLVMSRDFQNFIECYRLLAPYP